MKNVNQDYFDKFKYNKRQKKEKKFEVYIAKDKGGNILYIGSGATGRSNHCISGISSVYELNKMHFDGEYVDIVIHATYDTKEDSLKSEKELILIHEPPFNRQYLKGNLNASISGVRVKILIQVLYKELLLAGYNPRNRMTIRFMEWFEEVLARFKLKGLTSGITLTGTLRLQRDNPETASLCGKTKISKVFEKIFYRDRQFIKLKDEYVKLLTSE